MRNIIASIIVSFLLPYASFVNASQCPSNNVVDNPQVFQWTHHPVTANNPEEYYSGTLEFGEANFTISGETITTRAYRQAGSEYSIPGPTLNMTPGKKYVVRYNNLLPYEPLNPEHNIFKDPNASNLHTHGLHISGETPSDDVTRFFEGGYGGDFVYDIPANHMGGTYWYHAHHHGSTMLQVSGGAFGLIVIDDEQDGIPANVANMVEREIIIAYLDPGVAGTGGDTLISGTLSPTWTTNGTVAGNLCMPTNTWQHWRVLLADRDARSKTITIGSQCEVALMARDGVWRTAVPKVLTGNSITITGASRADLAVRCSGDADISVGNTVVANIYVDGIADSTVHPFAEDGVSTWSAIRPDYLQDLRGVTNVNTEKVNMGARTINGSQFDKNVPTFSLPTDDVQEWTIKGATNHPFHLHVYHVQPTVTCGDFEGGEYYDVIASGCKVRFNLNASTSSVYEGRTIMHCHILGHEDQGAMGWLDVLGGSAAPTFPVNGDEGITYQNYYSLSVSNVGTAPNSPSNMVAATSSSSQIDLTWVDNASDETGFRLERSTEGVNFILLSTLAADSVAYSDTGLTANTTYTYKVLAYNGTGDSAFSNEASYTTQADVAGTSLQVRSVTITTVSVGKGLKHGRATVVIEDDQGNSIQNANVAGEFTGTFNEVINSSDPSDINGSVSIDTTDTAKGGVSVTFCVTGISHPDLVDFAAASGEVCGSL